jgi:hypothetical protein
VSESDSASSWVDVVTSQTEDFGVGFDHGSESLVELPDGNVFLLEAGLLEELVNAGGGGNGEVDGICYTLVCERRELKTDEHTNSSISIGDDLRQHPAVFAVLLCDLLAAQYQG